VGVLTFAARRLGQLAVVLLGVSTLLFFLLRLSGDPAQVVAGAEATPEQLEAVRLSLGLDAPLAQQYVTFVADAVRLDFGTSFLYNTDAREVALSRFGASAELTAVAVLLAMGIALPAGVYSAVRKDSASGSLVTVGTLVGQSVPNFVVGVLLLLVFSVRLGWLPSFGNDGWRSVVLPAITLSLFMMARQTRLVRALMVDELSKDYVRSAVANGVPVRRVRYRLALRNVLVPVLSLAAVDLGALLGGAVVTESLFAWPGVGRLLVDSVGSRDYPVVQASVFLIAVVVVLINFAMEIVNRLVDPTLRRPR